MLTPVAAAWFPTLGADLEGAVQTATGWPGLGIIFVYSFLIAFLLPLPSEVVLGAYSTLALGVPDPVVMGFIVVSSGAGKALGSVFAFHIGQEAKEAGPIVQFLERSRFDVVAWSEKAAVRAAKRWGYAGLALALCVPGFPDTISIYAFSVLEEDYARFAVATFAGSVGRLLVTLGAFGVVTFV